MCWRRCRRAKCVPDTPKSRNTACSATRSFSRGWSSIGAVCSATAVLISPTRSRQASKPRRRLSPVMNTKPVIGRCLNLGHTFGHALEAWTGFSNRLLHGEGVSIGMCLAFRLSEELGHCPEGHGRTGERHLKAVGLPVHINDIPGGKADADELMRLMARTRRFTKAA